MITSCNHSATEQLCGSCREKNHRQSILDDKDAEVSSLRTRVARLEDALKELLDYIRACEGLLNSTESLVCVKARRALEEK